MLENLPLIVCISVLGFFGLGVLLVFELSEFPHPINNILNAPATKKKFKHLEPHFNYVRLMMKRLLFICITLLISTHALANTLIPRSVAGDKGKYYLIKKSESGNIISTLHKRIGVDSVVYTSTKINCKTKQIQEIGNSEVSAQAIKPNPTKWFDLVTGSSKYDLYKFVCKK